MYEIDTCSRLILSEADLINIYPTEITKVQRSRCSQFFWVKNTLTTDP